MHFTDINSEIEKDVNNISNHIGSKWIYLL